MARDYDEKRDFIRMVVDCPVAITNPANGETFQGIACDLSSKGLAFTTATSLAPGTPLEVRIVPDQTLVPPLHARVQVVRVEPDTSGARFRVGTHIEDYLD